MAKLRYDLHICSGCCKCFYGDLETKRTYFSQFQSWEVQDQGASRFSVLWGPASWIINGCLLLCPHMVEGVRLLPRVLFIRALILLLRAPPSWLSHLPKTSTPNISNLEHSFSTHVFQGPKHLVCWLNDHRQGLHKKCVKLSGLLAQNKSSEIS